MVQCEKEEGTIIVRNMNGYQREYRREKKVMGVHEYDCGQRMSGVP